MVNQNNENSSPNQNLDNYNLFNACGPGLSEIVGKVNKKRYIGEANNVLDRLAKHTGSLICGLSDCSELQKDWNQYGLDGFEAHVIFIGPEWENKEVRLKKETELISSYNPEEVQNFHPSTIKEKQENYRVVCEIKGQRFNSIAEASNKTNEAESLICAKLKNQFPGYVIIEKRKHGYEPIIANGKPYSSIKQAVEAGEAKDRFEAGRRLKSQKHKDWNYQSLEKKLIKTTKKRKTKK